MKRISKKDANNLEIKITDKGFTIWFTDKKGNRRRIIDASMIKKDGEIRLGNPNLSANDVKHVAVYTESSQYGGTITIYEK